MNSTEQQKQDTVAATAESRAIVSKKEAASKGLNRYFTGKPCRRGHLVERLVSSGKCQLCMNAGRDGLPLVRKPKGYWFVRENIEEESKKYKTKTELNNKNSRAYKAACSLGILNELFTEGRKHNGYWNDETCAKEALMYESLSDFFKLSGSAYQYACKNGIIAEISEGMIRGRAASNYWTFENCKDEAEKYISRRAFQALSSGCYDKARTEGWINKITTHMVSGYKISNCVYIWKVLGFTDVFKIGLTYDKIAKGRIYDVCKSNNLESEWHEVFLIKGNAYQVEQEALMFGKKFSGFSGDGYTEFRVLSVRQYQDLINFIQSKA